MQFAWTRFSIVGLLAGTLFFALSLTPSLVPRAPVMQGILCGVALAAGYGVGVLAVWLWSYLELPRPSPRTERLVTIAAAALSALVAAVFLWQATAWQNSVRMLMEMEPAGTAQPLTVGAIALLLFAVLLGVAKLFRRTFGLLSRRLQRYVPRRVSNVVGVVVAVALFWSIIDGVLVRYALRATDASFQQIDALIDDDAPPPQAPWATGGPISLIAWKDLGRQGRNFISSGPSAADLHAFLGHRPRVPLRVYVGLNSAETPAARAKLALAELQRVGAFERSVLILLTPTGTGWIDPAGIDTIEYLHAGDIASVAVQYSYLPSPLSLLVEADYGAETARALFTAVYEHWTKLDRDARPALYLHGLSLGALNSDLSFDIFDVIGDPPQGALWSGPPFRSETWRATTAERRADSPAWLPRFRDGSVVRFANQQGGLEDADAPWGPLRLAFLQYASDPITFFEPAAFYREPEWMREPRGPDVSAELRWYPIVTMLQLAADMAAGSAPKGFGHEYAAADYIDAWLSLTEPAGWTDADIARLKRHFDRTK